MSHSYSLFCLRLYFIECCLRDKATVTVDQCQCLCYNVSVIQTVLGFLETFEILVLQVCDDVWDCQNGEDEIHCPDHLSCSGLFRCQGHSNCLHLSEVCDGVSHCSEEDDELFCAGCVLNCECMGLWFRCSLSTDKALSSISQNVIYLSLVHSMLNTEFVFFHNFKVLLFLDLSYTR